MAGRGTDILLGGNPPKDREKVVELGGLYVIGTTRHEARRIDNQLRGRAGRQGDPGASRFFISLEDDLLVRFGIAENPDIDSVQRTAESQNLEIRETLWKYDVTVETSPRRGVQRCAARCCCRRTGAFVRMLPEEQYRELSEAGRRGCARNGWARNWRWRSLTISGPITWRTSRNCGAASIGFRGAGAIRCYEFLTGVQEIYADFQECLKEENCGCVCDGRDSEWRDPFRRSGRA